MKDLLNRITYNNAYYKNLNDNNNNVVINNQNKHVCNYCFLNNRNNNKYYQINRELYNYYIK